ncbi:heterokaryon incompatibility protein-domain-containing protein [Xylariaceae sp. FL0662B]|nr:heterokaryon incompatibility protein-domain-containing protein [Xylariaceae sp. FL0662B]
MYLIDVHDFSLHMFIGENIPPYAILSHTWGEEEVSFQDMTNVPAARKKKGFAKIAGCCAQTIREGLDWAWVDTCCIDKSSSAELSEAINSMFQWYKQSVVCFAFLEDLQDLPDLQYLPDLPVLRKLRNLDITIVPGSRAPPINDSKHDFRHSRWFTRGWTLQELLAPYCVLFFNRDWSYLGTRNEWKGSLSVVTSIPENVLDGTRSMKSYGVYDRLHWASRRETTRVEDKAYCLLGLFDVNMPLLYGEGNKAFSRLQAEIIQKTQDHSIFLHGRFQNLPCLHHFNIPEHYGLSSLLAPDLVAFACPRRIQQMDSFLSTDNGPFGQISNVTAHSIQITLFTRPLDLEGGNPLDDDALSAIKSVEKENVEPDRRFENFWLAAFPCRMVSLCPILPSHYIHAKRDRLLKGGLYAVLLLKATGRYFQRLNIFYASITTISRSWKLKTCIFDNSPEDRLGHVCRCGLNIQGYADRLFRVAREYTRTPTSNFSQFNFLLSRRQLQDNREGSNTDIFTLQCTELGGKKYLKIGWCAVPVERLHRIEWWRNLCDDDSMNRLYWAVIEHNGPFEETWALQETGFLAVVRVQLEDQYGHERRAVCFRIKQARDETLAVHRPARKVLTCKEINFTDIGTVDPPSIMGSV